MTELDSRPASGNSLGLIETAGAATPAGTIKPSGQLIDKHGHLHSEAIFKNWSPAAIKALGIRRIEAEGGGAQ